MEFKPHRALFPWTIEYFVGGVIAIFLLLAAIFVSTLIWPPEDNSVTN